MSRISAGLILLITMLLTSALADCPGVTHTEFTAGNWETHSFFESSSTNPLIVTLDVKIVDPNTDVEYFDGSSWIEITQTSSVEGSKIRFTEGGSVAISYRYEDCGDEIVVPPDE